MRGHGAAVKLLLSKGALINAQNDEGLTPLHYAVLYNDFDTAKILIEQVCRRILTNKLGRYSGSSGCSV